MGHIVAGTSGFSYTAWRGDFYPADLSPSGMLEYYAARLNGLELNGSFYHLPTSSALLAWASSSPPGFQFCFKAPRGVTYSGAAFDKAGLAALTRQRLDVLGAKLGPVLLQWPPTRPRQDELLEEVLQALAVPAAVEFRHPSWFCQAVYARLQDHACALVVTDDEKWPMAPRIETSGFSYYRLRRDYSPIQFSDWQRELWAEARSRESVHIYFEHSAGGPARALAMLQGA